MCGILGWVGGASTTPASLERIKDALGTLENRGPDGTGLHRGEDWVLGQTRLAVLDLTDHAAQPMRGKRGTWLVFNGEIYNFRELRRELQEHGVQFDSSGDTQVLLEALEFWGVAVIPRLRGMFAFGWLNPARGELILARDRYGVKPLAWERAGGGVRFGSDLFALDAMAGGAQTRDIDPEQAWRYLLLGYVPAPYTIWKGPRKLRPGCYLRVSFKARDRADVEEKSYWKITDIPPASSGGNGTSYARFKEELAEAIRLRLISDVPVGLLLSGGVDSSLVGAAYAEFGSGDIPSFTMGFADKASDERPYARAVAAELKLRHEDFVADDRVENEFDDVWNGFDEPFADSSALPMVTLCREIRKRVKVAIGGDGGDEVWCGYPWHRALARAERARGATPGLRAAAMLAAQFARDDLGYRARVLAAPDRLSAWAALRIGISDRMAASLPIEGVRLPVTACFQEAADAVGTVADPLDWACRMDLLTYLPDDLMVKADRASMCFGLELREPLLDHEFTAFGLSLPVSTRFDRVTGQGKLFARRFLAERLSDRSFERPKQGFTPPLPAWLNGPLAERKRQAVADLEAGRLGPFSLPASLKSWDACAERLDDRHAQFLWRLVCFSGWASARAGARRSSRAARVEAIH